MLMIKLEIPPPMGGDRISRTPPSQLSGTGGPVGNTPSTPNYKDSDPRSPDNVLDRSVSDNVRISDTDGAAALAPAVTITPSREDDPERTTEQQPHDLTFGDDNWQYNQQLQQEQSPECSISIGELTLS